MAVLPTTHPTLLDLAKRTDPDNTIAQIVELMNQKNEVLTDMVFVEGNLPTGHRTTVRTGLPEPTWRRLYGGVQPTKSTTAQVTENTAMLEAYAEVDKALADLNGNTAAFRLSEDLAHIEGIAQELARNIFYGNEALEPEKFTGFVPRYNDLSASNGDNIIPASNTDTGDLGSIWLIVWGPNTIHGIVPKGSTAGLQITDKGQVTIENIDGQGGRMEAYRTHYRQDSGLVVRDWRSAVRIANIPRDAVKAHPTIGSDVVLSDLMFEAIERVDNLGAGRAAFYADRAMITKIRQQAASLVRNSTLTIEQQGGIPLMMFQGIPIRRVDALAVDETLVS